MGILNRFMQKNEEWLNIVVISSGSIECTTSGSGGLERCRPKIPFEDASQQTKRRRIKDILDSTSKEDLCLATQMKLFSSGHKDAAAVVRKISFSPKSARQIKKCDSKEGPKINLIFG